MQDSKAVKDWDQETFDNAVMFTIFGFVVWLLLVALPLMLVFKPDWVVVRLGIIVAYVPVCRWLFFSKNGPGVEGVKAVLVTIVSMIVSVVMAVPARIRFWLTASLFVAASLGMAAHLVHLVASDEVAQKRALYGSFEPNRDIKWFHSGDKIDVFVFSDYMDRTFEIEQGEVGVHLSYSQDDLKHSNDAFALILKADLRKAERGKTSTVADSEIAVYEANRSPLAGVSYHGAFGFTGVGLIEVILGTVALFMALTLIYADKEYRKPGFLALATLLFCFLMGAGQGGPSDSDSPTKIAPFTASK